jgi:hypothetical protein
VLVRNLYDGTPVQAAARLTEYLFAEAERLQKRSVDNLVAGRIVVEAAP